MDSDGRALLQGGIIRAPSVSNIRSESHSYRLAINCRTSSLLYTPTPNLEGQGGTNGWVRNDSIEATDSILHSPVPTIPLDFLASVCFSRWIREQSVDKKVRDDDQWVSLLVDFNRVSCAGKVIGEADLDANFQVGRGASKRTRSSAR